MFVWGVKYLYEKVSSLEHDGNTAYLAAVLAVVLGATFFQQWWSRVRKLPPGPWSLPFVGYRPLTNFVKPEYQVLEHLSKQYGPIVSVKKGRDLVVALCSTRLIRMAFRKEEFTGRPYSLISEILGDYGVINVEGKLWKEQRRFLHERLRSFGMKIMGSGKKLEGFIQNEVHCLLDVLGKDKGQPLNPTSHLTTSVSNVICSAIMSVRFPFGDPEFARYMHLVEQGFVIAGALFCSRSDFPLMNYFNDIQGKVEQLRKHREEIGLFFRKILDDHRRDYNRDNIRDLVDSYLFEIEKAKEENRDGFLFDGRDPDRQMEQIMADLFSAGMETVRTTLLWSLLLMLHNPEVQANVQKELDDVVGSHRLPELSDLPHLPYTEATIFEILRHSSIVPLGTTHAATKDVELDGFLIPKDTHIIPLLNGIHHDPTLWEEPEKFNPERFLDINGKVFKPDYFIPFGVGRRMCLGDVMARMEIFMFFASILHTYHLRVPEGQSLPSLDRQVGITVTPMPFQMSYVVRKPHLISAGTTPLTGDSVALRNYGA